MDYSSLLNERQLQAVTAEDKYLRIIAGAGSGKTRVLTYRISFLISELSVRPENILAIAFTNKVAKEMKERAVALVPYANTRLRISTFHSFCARFLREDIGSIDYPLNFTIIDEEDQVSLLKEIGVELGYKKKDDIIKKAYNFICHNKCKGIYAEDVILPSHCDPDLTTCLKFFHIYEEKKDAMGCLDFDDLLLRTIQILEKFEDIRNKWTRRIRHILIDEFQDTNDVQFKLVKLLMDQETSLYVVGDPDQTIYTWRGANQDIIVRFDKTFPLTKTIVLDRNYRSTKTILDAANKLISHNKKRVPKDLYTLENAGTPIIVKKCWDKESEAKYVADKIEELKNTEKDFKYSDVCILYRANYLTPPFENEFVHRHIPHAIIGGTKFYQRKEIKDVLAFLRLAFNTKDDISFERIINVPKRGIGDASLDIFRSEKLLNDVSYYDYIKNIDNYETDLKSKHILSLSILIQNIEDLRRKLDAKDEAYSSVIENFLTKILYFDYLKNEDDGDDRIDNVKALMGYITDFFKNEPNRKFEDYLMDVTLSTSQDDLTDENSSKVLLMTVHVAKGLEFKYVFVIGMSDGVFPSDRTLNESGHDGEEEERRLCYVAFTRAKEKLFISYNGSYSFVLQSHTEESRFIKEANLEVIRDTYSTSRQIGHSRNAVLDQIISEFEPDPEPQDDIKTDNGISNWAVGDIAIHETFGRGIVTAVIDDSIIEIEFENHGKKSIMSRHPKLSKEDIGGIA